MKKEYRLQKNYQFSHIYKKGSSVSDRFLILIYCKNSNKKLKIGFSISKKYGNAVERNRIKRQLRECVDKKLTNIDETFNYIILPRALSNDKPNFIQLLESLEGLLRKAKLYKQNIDETKIR